MNPTNTKLQKHRWRTIGSCGENLSPPSIRLALVLAVGLIPCCMQAQSRHDGPAHGGTPSAPAKSPPPPASTKKTAPKLPPLPPGVTELKFSDFFVHPVGPRGLEFTEKLRQLDGISDE